MSPLKAHVRNGRIVLDVPTTLPDGTMIDLVADYEGDDLTDDERRSLHEAVSASWKSAEDGRASGQHLQSSMTCAKSGEPPGSSHS